LRISTPDFSTQEAGVLKRAGGSGRVDKFLPRGIVRVMFAPQASSAGDKCRGLSSCRGGGFGRSRGACRRPRDNRGDTARQESQYLGKAKRADWKWRCKALKRLIPRPEMAIIPFA